ncbi:hypothetical protein B0H13DRAFT_2542205 [Mycena leptocephala]|nr:hypothetical protein B0H13DRAFT_2542205 [Mycena leptocephala]
MALPASLGRTSVRGAYLPAAVLSERREAARSEVRGVAERRSGAPELAYSCMLGDFVRTPTDSFVTPSAGAISMRQVAPLSRTSSTGNPFEVWSPQSESLGLLASVIPLVFAISVKKDFEDLYGVLGASITVNHETSSVKLGACEPCGIGENGGLDDIGRKYEFDMMEELIGVTGQEGTTLPNVSTFVTALEGVSQIFIVGDDVIRPWRVLRCFTGVQGLG